MLLYFAAFSIDADYDADIAADVAMMMLRPRLFFFSPFASIRYACRCRLLYLFSAYVTSPLPRCYFVVMPDAAFRFAPSRRTTQYSPALSPFLSPFFAFFLYFRHYASLFIPPFDTIFFIFMPAADISFAVLLPCIFRYFSPIFRCAAAAAFRYIHTTLPMPYAAMLMAIFAVYIMLR